MNSATAIGMQSYQAGKMAALTDRANLAAAEKADRNDARIKDVAQQFETMFIAQMLSHMNEDGNPDPNFGGGQAEQMFKSLLNDQYAEQVERRGGIGLAPAIERYLKGTELQAQEIPR